MPSVTEGVNTKTEHHNGEMLNGCHVPGDGMAWLTPEFQHAADKLADPIYHGMRIQIIGQGGCGYHEPTADVAKFERYAREIGHDASFELVSANGKIRTPLPQRGNDKAEQPRKARCGTKCMADIAPCDVRWLWPGYLPLGKLTILAGDPGLGKSYASMDFAARTSSGSGWPTEPEQRYEQSTVVILNAEDDVSDTVRPRLDALEANCRNIHIVDGVYRTAEADQAAHLSLAADLSLLEDTIIDKRARLLIVDPLSAYLGQVDSHRDAEVRSILSPLRDLAERRGLAVVAIMHLNKGTGTNAMQRAIGSVAFGAAARMMWLVAADPDNEQRRLLLPMKSNLKDQGPGLGFTITEVGQIAWDQTTVYKTANEVLAEAAESARPSQTREAAMFLQSVLAGGSMDSKEVLGLAKEEGITAITLKRAKKSAGVASVRDGYGGGWRWELSRGSTADIP